jgi:hypothetical protein
MSPYNLYGCNPILNVDKKGDIMTKFPMANNSEQAAILSSHFEKVYSALNQLISQSPRLQKIVEKAEAENTIYDVYIFHSKPYTSRDMFEIPFEETVKVSTESHTTWTYSCQGEFVRFDIVPNERVDLGYFSRNFGTDLFNDLTGGWNYKWDGTMYTATNNDELADIMYNASFANPGYEIIQLYDELAHAYFPFTGEKDHVAMYALLKEEFLADRLVLNSIHVVSELETRWLRYGLMEIDDELHQKLKYYMNQNNLHHNIDNEKKKNDED